MKVFVYGTLKEGYGNNRILQDGNAVKIGQDFVKGYVLYDSGFPVAYKVGTDDYIVGEVWDIGCTDEDLIGYVTLQRLDWLEGEGSMYHRVLLQTTNGHTVGMYEGREPFWDFERMELCPSEMDEAGEKTIYKWSRW